MMKQMRENTKVILWVVVAAFVVTIFAVWGLDLQTTGITGQGPGAGLVGKVNGVPVTPQAYQAAYAQIAQQYRASAPEGQLTAMQQELLRDQAWESIVTNILTEQQVEKLGITVTDQEVLSYLRNSPPPEIRQYFVDDKGQFDYAAYQAALNNPDADWTAVEQLARQRIPLIKLNQYLIAQVHVGHDEILRKFEEESTRMVAEYVSFPIGDEDTGDYTPDEEEIAAYYTDHQDEFNQPEKAAIAYVRIPLEPTDADREYIAANIAEIRQMILDGDDFGALARSHSEGRTATAGGDVGFVRAEQRDPAIIMAANNLQPGEISGPVWTPDGVYLIKLMETREVDGETEYHLAEIEFHLSAGPATIDSLNIVARDVQQAAAGEGLEAAAAASGLEVETAPPFAANTPIPGIGFVPALSRFAFSGEPGAVSNIISDDENYYVATITERIPESTRPLDEVREQISAALLSERQREKAMRKAGGFFRSLRSSDAGFDATLSQYGLVAAKTDTFLVRDRVADGIPPYSAFAYAALEAPKIYNELLTPPIESDGVIYVLRVLYRSELDGPRFQQQADAIRDRIFQRKVQEYIAYWYKELREKSVIEDYRGTI